MQEYVSVPSTSLESEVDATQPIATTKHLSGFGAGAKRGFDFTFALITVACLIPLLVMVGLLCVAAQGRPVFIRHSRVGRNGKAFACYKFRTMVVNGEAVIRRHLERDPAAHLEWELTRKLRNDPRVTRLGRVLRSSSVDELPQLLNILRGDMSFVGPRPIVEDEIRLYGRDIKYYYKTRPGLTGSWQVSGRNDVSYDGRVRMDVEYVKRQSLGRDLVIIAKTLPAVLRGSY